MSTSLWGVRLWQIHLFREGNTRTTAVFFIKYLRTLGFDATNDIFAENAMCFGRTIVEDITGLKSSGVSKLIKILVDSEVIVPVTGHGKGKYRLQYKGVLSYTKSL